MYLEHVGLCFLLQILTGVCYGLNGKDNYARLYDIIGLITKLNCKKWDWSCFKTLHKRVQNRSKSRP